MTDVDLLLAAAAVEAERRERVTASWLIDVLLDVRNLTHHPGTVAAVDTELSWLRDRRLVDCDEAQEALAAVWTVHSIACDEQWWCW